MVANLLLARYKNIVVKNLSKILLILFLDSERRQVAWVRRHIWKQLRLLKTAELVHPTTSYTSPRTTRLPRIQACSQSRFVAVPHPRT